MKIELDMHTHTLASGHAFSTIQEMAKAGAEKGLKLLGITEHTPGIPGTCDPIYFRNLHVVPRQMYGIDLMLGAEINILDGKGTLDADEALMKKLDIRIAGIHLLCYEHDCQEISRKDYNFKYNGTIWAAPQRSPSGKQPGGTRPVFRPAPPETSHVLF